MTAYRHFMLDLETMGSGNSAAIVSIGAVAMDLEKLELGAEFYCVVDLRSSVSHGGTVDADTVKWWLRQEEGARAMLFLDQQTLPRALEALTAFFGGDRNGVIVWGNGATFDNVILRSAYRGCGMAEPWNYKNDLCFRTLRRLFPVPYEHQGTKHNAADDARAQARAMLKIVGMLQNIGDEYGEVTWSTQGGLPEGIL